MASEAQLQLEFDKLGYEYFRLRVLNAMQRSGIVTLGDLRTTSEWHLLQQYGFGKTSLQGLKAGLVRVIRDVHPGPDAEEASKNINLISSLLTWSEDLKYRDREIFRHRLGLTTATGGGDLNIGTGEATGIFGPPKTLEYIGEIFKVSRERIRQLFKKIIKKTRRSQWAVEFNDRISRIIQSKEMVRLSEITELDIWFSNIEKSPQAMKVLVSNLCKGALCDQNPFFGNEIGITIFKQQDLKSIYEYLDIKFEKDEYEDSVSNERLRKALADLQAQGVQVELHQLSKLLICLKRERHKAGLKKEADADSEILEMNKNGVIKTKAKHEKMQSNRLKRELSYLNVQQIIDLNEYLDEIKRNPGTFSPDEIFDYFNQIGIRLDFLEAMELVEEQTGVHYRRVEQYEEPARLKLDRHSKDNNERNSESFRTKDSIAWNKEKIAKVREVYPKAWSPWSFDDDEKLINLLIENKSVKEISRTMGRKPGAIRSRIKKKSLEDIPSNPSLSANEKVKDDSSAISGLYQRSCCGLSQDAYQLLISNLAIGASIQSIADKLGIKKHELKVAIICLIKTDFRGGLNLEELSLKYQKSKEAIKEVLFGD